MRRSGPREMKRTFVLCKCFLTCTKTTSPHGSTKIFPAPRVVDLQSILPEASSALNNWRLESPSSSCHSSVITLEVGSNSGRFAITSNDDSRQERSAATWERRKVCQLRLPAIARQTPNRPAAINTFQCLLIADNLPCRLGTPRDTLARKISPGVQYPHQRLRLSCLDDLHFHEPHPTNPSSNLQ